MSALLGAVYFPATGNLFITFCLNAAEAPMRGGSWFRLALAACGGSLVGALSGAYALERVRLPAEDEASRVSVTKTRRVRPEPERAVGAVLVPALAECALLGSCVLVGSLVNTGRAPTPHALLEVVANTALMSLCWLPMACIQTLYFAFVTRMFAACACRSTRPRALAAAGMVGLGFALSALSVRMTPSELSALIPSELVDVSSR